MNPPSSNQEELTFLSQILPDVLKEISRRAELRPRLEAELGRALDGEEFIKLAEQTGLII